VVVFFVARLHVLMHGVVGVEKSGALAAGDASGWLGHCGDGGGGSGGVGGVCLVAAVVGV
jgi:hypothetical protein